MTAHLDIASTAWALVALTVALRLFRLGRDALVARAAEVAAAGEVTAVATRLAKLEQDAEERLVRLENHYRGR